LTGLSGSSSFLILHGLAALQGVKSLFTLAGLLACASKADNDILSRLSHKIWSAQFVLEAKPHSIFIYSTMPTAVLSMLV
jgi:hypothetical protein